LFASRFLRHLSANVFAKGLLSSRFSLFFSNTSLPLELFSFGEELGSLKVVLFALKAGLSVFLSACKIIL